MDNRPIGVFDSGIGGLTVAKEILQVLPQEKIIYIAGSPITYSMSIPINSPDKDLAIKFIRYLLHQQREPFAQYGFILFKPAYYGDKDQFSSFSEFVQYSGDF